MASKTADQVFLKLVFSVDDAKKSADEVNKSLNESREHAQNVATSFQATVQGRLLTGLAGAVRGTLGAVFNDELPVKIAEAELQIKALGAATGAVLGPQAGAIAEGVGRQAFKGDLTAAQNTFQTLQALQNIFPEEALDERDVAAVTEIAFKQHQKVYDVNATLRERVNSHIPSLQMDGNKVAEGITRMGSAIAGASAGIAKAIPGVAPAMEKLESWQDAAADKIAGWFGW